MATSTRATTFLDKLGITFSVHSYDYDPAAEHIGLQAAERLGIEPRCLLKTMMTEVNGKPVCVLVPTNQEIKRKKLADTFGGNTTKMKLPADAKLLTGYHIGE